MQNMKVVLATGIYPPDIGGPATYVRELARRLHEKGVEVVVVTYVSSFVANFPCHGEELSEQSGESHESMDGKLAPQDDTFPVIRVKKSVPIFRWIRYTKALRTHAKGADIVYAFSSVSCGVPLWLAGLKRPKKVLRLGGDFLWERYTDYGGKKSLRELYEKPFLRPLIEKFMQPLLRAFDVIVFSTAWQQLLYEENYKTLPSHQVIENALSISSDKPSERGPKHTPFRLLFMGRFVGFKNLDALLEAVQLMDGVQLTLVGDGPLSAKLQSVKNPMIRFLPAVHGEEKRYQFSKHDLLVLPSLTEISPNVALEARANGMPVLLTEETGLSEELRQSMIVRPLRTSEQIRDGIMEVVENYENIRSGVQQLREARPWSVVCEEHVDLFTSLLREDVSS